MGINVNVSTQTTPGLLLIEQPDVTGSWDNPMVMVECVWGFSNQLTYGDYNEVTIGGYFDICLGVLLEVVLGPTVEVISPLAVEVIRPMGPLQPLLAALGSGPAMAAAGAAGWAGRTSVQGGSEPGLQYDVVFGNYVESVSKLKFTQHGGNAYESDEMKTEVAETHGVYCPTADHQECIGTNIGTKASSGAKTLVSNAGISLTASSGPLCIYGGTVNIASTAANVAIVAVAQVSISNTNYPSGCVNISGADSILLTVGGSQVAISDAEIWFTAAKQTFSSGSPYEVTPTPFAAVPLSLAAAIISQAAAAAAAANAWAASADAEIAAMQAWNPE